jgi:hypothetical protein
MILIDVNLLLYAHHRASLQHERSRLWLEQVLSGVQPVGLAWATIVSFIRISTSARILARPLTLDEAIGIVAGWLSQPTVAILEPGEGHWSIFSQLLKTGQATGPLASDAHLAALAIEHGATLCSNDRDFSRFPNLKLLNPLEPE